MDTTNLNYIKNVSNDMGWAYAEHPVSSYFLLHFSRSCLGADNHAFNLPKGSLIILSQKPPKKDHRYLTHVVELVNDGIEDRPQWKDGEDFGILRWVKVLWAADFSDINTIPVDKDVLKAKYMIIGTKANLLEHCADLMTQWGDIDSLRTHLESVFN